MMASAALLDRLKPRRQPRPASPEPEDTRALVRRAIVAGWIFQENAHKTVQTFHPKSYSREKKNLTQCKETYDTYPHL